MNVQHPHALFQDLETQYSLQNTSEEIVHSIANNKTLKHTRIRFKIVIPGDDTSADTCVVFKTLPII